MGPQPQQIKISTKYETEAQIFANTKKNGFQTHLNLDDDIHPDKKQDRTILPRRKKQGVAECNALAGESEFFRGAPCTAAPPLAALLTFVALYSHTLRTTTCCMPYDFDSILRRLSGGIEQAVGCPQRSRGTSRCCELLFSKIHTYIITKTTRKSAGCDSPPVFYKKMDDFDHMAT